MVVNGWLVCADCKCKLFKVDKSFIIKGVELKCKKCKRIIKLNEQSLEP